MFSDQSLLRAAAIASNGTSTRFDSASEELPVDTAKQQRIGVHVKIKHKNPARGDAQILDRPAMGPLGSIAVQLLDDRQADRREEKRAP